MSISFLPYFIIRKHIAFILNLRAAGLNKELFIATTTYCWIQFDQLDRRVWEYAMSEGIAENNEFTVNNLWQSHISRLSH